MSQMLWYLGIPRWFWDHHFRRHHVQVSVLSLRGWRMCNHNEWTLRAQCVTLEGFDWPAQFYLSEHWAARDIQKIEASFSFIFPVKITMRGQFHFWGHSAEIDEKKRRDFTRPRLSAPFHSEVCRLESGRNSARAADDEDAGNGTARRAGLVVG